MPRNGIESEVLNFPILILTGKDEIMKFRGQVKFHVQDNRFPSFSTSSLMRRKDLIEEIQ